MVRYFVADIVLPIARPAIKDGVVAVDDEGVIVAVHDVTDLPKDVKVERLSGTLIPGFVNTHCHLELSHMQGKIPANKGLVDFILQVNEHRSVDDNTVQRAMKSADKTMFANGIQAVGDHVNTAISAKTKEQSKMYYHTFVEIIGVQEAIAAERIDKAKDTEFHFDQKHTSITPHAPYSCSKSLFRLLKKSIAEENILSIHNQESEEENKLFRYRSGDFLRLYEALGININSFKAQARNSLQSYLPHLPNRNKLILVHNTFTSMKDLDFIRRMNREVIFCLCPKANLYIENTLPKLALLENDFMITIGTDSLASNDSLDILAELKTLHQHYPELDFLKTIQWATLNGAKALNMDADIGSIEVGKKPGLVLLKNMLSTKLTDDVKVERII